MSGETSNAARDAMVRPRSTDRSAVVRSLIARDKTQGMTVARGLPPGSFRAPTFPPDAVYANSPEFKAIVQRGMQNPDSLTADERSRFEAAQQLYPQAFQQQAPQIPPEKRKVVDSFMALKDEVLAAIANSSANGEGGIKQSWAGANALLSGIGELLAPKNLAGWATDANLAERNLSEEVQGSLSKAGLDPVEPGQEYTVYPDVGEPVTLKHNLASALATNFSLGAIRMVPELTAQLADNPYEFAKGMVTFPIHEAALILTAANPIDPRTGLPIVQYTRQEVEQARDELVKNPLGVAMLGLMAMGGLAKGRGILRDIKANRISVKAEDWQRVNKEAETLRAEREARNATGEGAVKEDNISEHPGDGAVVQGDGKDRALAPEVSGEGGETGVSGGLPESGAEEAPVTQAEFDAALSRKTKAEADIAGFEDRVAQLSKEVEGATPASQKNIQAFIKRSEANIAERRAVIAESDAVMSRPVAGTEPTVSDPSAQEIRTKEPETAPEVQPKDPWEMTKEEFENSHVFRGIGADNVGLPDTFWSDLTKARSFVGSNWDRAATKLRRVKGENIGSRSVGELRVLKNENVPKDLITDADGVVYSPQDWIKREPNGEIGPYAESLIREGKVVPPKADYVIPQEGVSEPHKYLVEQAAKQGKVGAGLADYPDLAAKYGKAQAPAKAEVISTGNEPADVLRNIAHHRREMTANDEFLAREDITPDQRTQIEGRQVELRDQIAKFEQERQRIQDAFDDEVAAEADKQPAEAPEKPKEKDAQASESVELGFLGSPKDYVETVRTMYNTAEDVAVWTKETIDKARTPAEMREGKDAALGAMAHRHMDVNEARVVAYEPERIINKAVPDPGRQLVMSHAVEQGPASKWWGQLNPLEKNLVQWLRELSHQWEQFGIENGLLEKPKGRPESQGYLFHHWINPETGKPYAAQFGEFAKTSPSLQKRSISTLEAGIGAGLEPATVNPGRLVGHQIMNLVKPHAMRQMYADLHSVELAPDVPAVMPWGDVMKQGLESEYVRDQSRYLDKPIRVRTKDGTLKEISGPVGIHKELEPWWKAYSERPNAGTLHKLIQNAKSLKLMGMFHIFNLGQQAAVSGAPSALAFWKGLDYMKDPTPTTRILVRNGLTFDTYREYDWSPKESLHVTGTNPVARTLDAALAPARGFSHLTFDVVHKGMKSQYCHVMYEKLIGEYLEQGLTADDCARAVVKQADRMFSGEDYQLALLETNKVAVKLWYAPEARKAWRNLLLSPTWQKSHATMAGRTLKAFTPDMLLDDPKAPIDKAYRRYAYGAVGFYATMNLYNWVATKQMDGEGRLMCQNPEGFKFKVRAWWNNPDGSTAWVAPAKSIFEVPEAVAALYGAMEDSRELGYFTNKLNPFISATEKVFRNLDEFGQTLEEKRTALETAVFWLDETLVPISGSQIFDTMKSRKAPIGMAFAFAGMPISKGPSGGGTGQRDEWIATLKDFQSELDAERKGKNRDIDDMIVDGDVSTAMYAMYEKGMKDKAMYNRLMKFRDRLLVNWQSMGQRDQWMFLSAMTPEDREKFLQEVYGGTK